MPANQFSAKQMHCGRKAILSKEKQMKGGGCHKASKMPLPKQAWLSINVSPNPQGLLESNQV